MKNKSIIIGIIFLIFLGLNYKTFLNFYYNTSGNYEKADNEVGEYNLGTQKYIDKKYDESIKSFSGVIYEGNKDLSFNNFYNLANSYYKKSEDKNLDEKIELLIKSVDNYRESLSIIFDEQSLKNLEFVEEKLRLAKLEQEKQKQEDSQESSDELSDESSKDESYNKEEDGESSDENTESNNSNEENGEVGESEEKELSEETIKILEEKAQELEDLQEEIGKFYNKTYIEKIDPFNNFDKYFDNSLLDNDGEEKDW